MKNKKKLSPLLKENEPVDWFFAFKFNSQTFPGGTVNGKPPKLGNMSGKKGDPGLFGGYFQAYKHKKDKKGNVQKHQNGKPKIVKIDHGQQYAVASSKNPKLTKYDNECIGTTTKDPLGATFNQVYNTDDFNYLIWNDQFYGDPPGKAKGHYTMGSLNEKTGKWINPDKDWGHSKGMLAWNEDGDGFVLQVSTPSWPASGSYLHPREEDGNTLGCIMDDDVEVSQHFFCLKINVKDLETILNALNNANVVTDPKNLQIAKTGGPSHIQNLINNLELGQKTESGNLTINSLTEVSGVKVISKHPRLYCPPWQLVSAILGGVPLRVASWWAQPGIYSTTGNKTPGCWTSQKGLEKPGPVEIALLGTWDSSWDKTKKGLKKTITNIGLKGSPSPGGNHAKLGISKTPGKPYSIFGDMNQMGALFPIKDKESKSNKKVCNIHQDQRGGLFFVVENKKLWESVSALLSTKSKDGTAPIKPPKKPKKPLNKKKVKS
jgi:hypothetical protein